MKVLVTGGAGFVARHLRNELLAAGHEVVLSDAVSADLPSFVVADVTDAVAMRQLVAQVRPDAVVHLGAISFVPDAAKQPDLLERVNVGGTENLLEAVVSVTPQARFLFVSTAQVLLPKPSAYALSKLKAEQRVERMAKERGLCCMIARPSNHTGPGQSAKFVVPGFVKQALEIKSGLRPCFTTGNLDSVRDFTDVRDVVRAYRLILEKGASGGTYPICSTTRMTMGQLLALVAEIVGVPSRHEVDEKLWRPTDASQVIDCSSVRQLGWEDQVALEQTLRDMVDVARIC